MSKKSVGFKKVDVILKSDLDAWSKAFEKTKKLENSFIKRIEYIIKSIHKVFGNKVLWWDYCNDRDGEGHFFQSYEETFEETDFNDAFFRYQAEINYKQDWDMAIIDKYNEEISLDYCFPTRWLIEDFEQELIDGKKAIDKFDDEQKNKSLKEQKEKNNKIKQIKKKLTKDELALLNLGK